MDTLIIIAVFAAGVWALNRMITATGVRPRIMTRNELMGGPGDEYGVQRMSFEIGAEYDHTFDR